MNRQFTFKYGKGQVEFAIPESQILHELTGRNRVAPADILDSYRSALDHPIDSPPLREMVKPGERILITVSDITRGWQRNGLVLPTLLDYLNEAGIRDQDVTIVIAVGAHRLNTPEEFVELCGEEACHRVKVVNHDCRDYANMDYYGKTSRGTEVWLNKLISQHDRLITTGGVIYHYAVGFAGGRKSIMPGLSSLKTIQQCHMWCFNETVGKGANPMTNCGFTVGNPPRIALDLPDTGNAMGRNTVEANLGPLSSVNVVQAGTRTRLVLNLSKSVEYEARIDGKTLLVALGDVGVGSAPVNVSPRFAEAAPGVARHSIRDIDFRRGAAGEARIVTTLSDAQAGINIRQQAGGVVVDFIGTELPKALQRRLDVADFGTPVQIVETYTLGDNTRMVIQPKGGWEYSAYQTDNSFIVEVKQSDDAQKKTADGKVKYTGEKLSLNFQNVEVRSVLQVIADFTGLNIIASDSVTGNLTLRLKDVPWDQALDLIMQTKGLDKRRDGNVIWVAPKDELMAKEKLEIGRAHV